MIASAARMSLVAMFTLGALALWGCGPQMSGGDVMSPADTETTILHIEGMT